MSTQSKLVSQLQDAIVLEGTLRRTLISHIAVSARDHHRSLLREHLHVTTEQERRLARRLADIDGSRNPAQIVVGAAKETAALGFTLAKGPLDALRGPSGDDVALRNAQDECASEALEIATYDALEVLAEQAGDRETAELARRHRAEEEDFLARLRETIPELAKNVARSGKGDRRFPLSTVGALDGVRALALGLQTVLGGGEAPRPTPPATPRTQPRDTAGADPAPAPIAKPTPAKPTLAAKPKPKPQPQAAAKPQPQAAATPKAAPTPPRAAKPKPAPKPAPVPAATPARKKPAGPEPIAQYGDMTPYEIEQMLDHLPAEKLDAIERYERAGEGREQVLDAIEAFRATGRA